MRLWRNLVAALALAAAPAAAQPAEDADDSALERFTSPTLTRFASDAEFEAYVAAVRARQRRLWGASRRVQFAQAEAQGQPAASDDPSESVCPPDDPACAPDQSNNEAAYVTVTGSRIATPRNASITNNQMRGVEEGDIVKQIGRFLLVLSDGRIFVIDTRPNGRPGLALADRIDVYRDPHADTWYDEMLVFGDRILITGYSYDEEATELAVFRLAPDGLLTAEGIFELSSNDYYDTSNYATRLIGDSLVIYTPLSLTESDAADFRFPVVRRWLPEDQREEAQERGKRLFDARSIYRPLRLETDPAVHTVSVCPLGPVGERDLECRSTAFVGPEAAEWYVTADEALLWTVDANGDDLDECEGTASPALADVVPAIVFRVPHDGSAPGVAGARGRPFDQFSLQANDGRLRALVDRRPASCERDWFAAVEPLYVDIPLAAFSPRLEEVPASRYADVPNPGTRWIANRFTERNLVYGGLSRYRRGVPDIDWDDYDDPESAARMRMERAIPPAFVVPADRSRDVTALDVGHTVIRAERYGADNIVLTGYRDRRGLSVTMLDLTRRPHVASTLRLDGRFESEGRSHAFNSLAEEDGTGLMGLPTTADESDARREWWRSRASDVSFMSVGRYGRIEDLGLLESRIVYNRRNDDDGLPDYECEVSCTDWYGNSRPIFTDGRVFALSGVELVEGAVERDGIVEVRRLDFARARPRQGRTR